MKYKLIFNTDSHPVNPREFSGYGRMEFYGKNVPLANKPRYNPRHYDSWLSMKNDIGKDGAAVILPIILYDNNDGCEVADFLYQENIKNSSGGFVYITEKELNDVFCGDSKFAKECLRTCVKEFNAYLRGDVFMVGIYSRQEDFKQCPCCGQDYDSCKDNWKYKDSCSSFYGEEAIIKELNSLVKTYPKAEIENNTGLNLGV